MGEVGPLGLLFILVIVTLPFGAKRLPDTAKSVGESLKIVKKSIRDDAAPPPPGQASPPTAQQPAPPTQ